MNSFIRYIDFVSKAVLKAVIKLYRYFISPFIGNNCRFYPTCSQYALDALNTKSFFKALPLIVKRVLKCHPYHNGGYDPVK